MRDVLAATLEVLAEEGYAGLSFEAVASRAHVNKTTVYRRWPAKPDLVRAAMFALRANDPEPPDTGSVREDLFHILKYRVSVMSSPRGRGIARALMQGGADPELQALIADLRREHPTIPKVTIERAVARGELPHDTDHALVGEALVGPLASRAYLKGLTVDDAFLARLVHLVVSGAAAGGAAAPVSADPRAPGSVTARRRRTRRAE